MMACLSKILSAQLYLLNMLLSVQVFANIHNRVQVWPLAINLDSFFVFASLNVKVSCFLPVIRVSLKLCLLNQNLWVQHWSIASSVFAMFSD